MALEWCALVPPCTFQCFPCVFPAPAGVHDHAHRRLLLRRGHAGACALEAALAKLLSNIKPCACCLHIKLLLCPILVGATLVLSFPPLLLCFYQLYCSPHSSTADGQRGVPPPQVHREEKVSAAQGSAAVVKAVGSTKAARQCQPATRLERCNPAHQTARQPSTLCHRSLHPPASLLVFQVRRGLCERGR